MWNVKTYRDRQKELNKSAERLAKQARSLLWYLRVQMLLVVLGKLFSPMLIGALILVVGYLLGHHFALVNLNVVD